MKNTTIYSTRLIINEKIVMKTSNFHVSAVVSMYNSEKYVGNCIQSILSQDYENFELIIVDDGSIDSSCKVVESFSDSRIRLFKREHNYISSLNYAIRKAVGKYIIHIDSDDIMHPTRFKDQINYMEEHPLIDISGCYMQSFGKRNSIMRCPISSDEIAAHLLWGVQIFHPTMIFRRDSLINNGMVNELYNPDVLLCEDYDMLTRAAIKGMKFGNLPKILVNYRISNNQLTSTKFLEIRRFMIKSRMKYYEYIMDLIKKQSNPEIFYYIVQSQMGYISGKYNRTKHLQNISKLCLKNNLFDNLSQ